MMAGLNLPKRESHHFDFFGFFFGFLGLVAFRAANLNTEIGVLLSFQYPELKKNSPTWSSRKGRKEQ
jgi:hypothetical protein